MHTEKKKRNMKNLLLILLFILPLCANAQSDELAIVKRVANHVCDMSNHDLIVNTDGSCVIPCYYQEWRYVNGVLGQAMIDLSQATKDEKYQEMVKANFDFFFDKTNFHYLKNQYDKGVRDYGYHRFFSMSSLDDCGAMGAALAKLNAIYPKAEYVDYLKKIEDYILSGQGRLEKGPFSRGEGVNETVWLDDLYMSLSFLTQYGSLYNKQVCLKLAADQALAFTRYLRDTRNGLFYHCYYVYENQPGVAHWGRANGWCLYALALLLDVLPSEDPQYSSVLDIYKNAVADVCRYQDANGMWHQLLDKSDSYTETSCTAMFAYSIAKGINKGWIDSGYGTVVNIAWKALTEQVTPQGELLGVCIGTGTSRDLSFYYNRPTPLNDAHGLGAFIQCGIEVSKMKKD